jgi:hypothetical protein
VTRKLADREMRGHARQRLGSEAIEHKALNFSEATTHAPIL